MSVVWLVAHLLGYIALLGRASYLALVAIVGRRDAYRGVKAARRIERIAKLELQCGIGLDYGREWVMAQKLRCERGMEQLVADGNGSCKRQCLGCDKWFKPHDEYPISSELSWYGQDADTRELTDRLCHACYLGATRELTLLTIHGIPEIA